MSAPDKPYEDSEGPPSLRVVTSNGSSTAAAPAPPPPAHLHDSAHDVSPPPRGGLLHPQHGIRTPRRVQWTSDSHIVQMHTIPPAPASPISQVDMHNLTQVDAALERHRSNPSRRRPLSEMSVESGGQASEEDYDYRLDRTSEDLQHVRSNESQLGNTDRRFEDLLDSGMNDHVTGHIQLGETDGLPNLRHRETEDDLKEAKNLVRAHTGKWGVLRRRVKGAGAVGRAFHSAASGSRHAEDPEKADPQTEGFAGRYSQDEPPRGMNLPGGASVLSSLLALYGQQNGMESGTTSAASSAPPSEDDLDDLEERKRLMSSGRDLVHRIAHPRQHHNTEQSTNDTSASGTPGEMVIHDESRHHRPSVVEDEDGNRRPSTAALGMHASQSSPTLDRIPAESPGFRDLFEKAKSTITQGKDRPKAARSGAGVFGALIQNTQNISGVATPAASTLAPAATRPGYQLSRYSAPDVNNPPPKVWRPTSRGSSRPGSVHSSTAVSQNLDDSPSTMRGEDIDLKKNTSSDDMLSMKKKNKSALSLHKIPGAILRDPGQAVKQGGQAFRNAEKWIMSAGRTPLTTPPFEKGDYFEKPLTEDERRRRDWEKEKKRRKKAKEARKKQEIFIIQHVAAILARQQFILKLARALMMFGSPSHRLETQIQATAKCLEINAQVVYLPGTMLISFGDDATHTSETKFLKQATGLDLGKLLATHHLYWNVVHDKMSVDDASKELDTLMTSPVYYNNKQMLLIGALCSAFITVIGFHGSFIDALMAMPLGVLLVGVQILAARNEMFSNVFEITIATIISFIAAALASTGYFCYTALVSGGVVLILPGYIVLCGALELASRNITAGAVRIGYSVIYSLFLGFGISIGAELYIKITGLQVIGSSDYTCYSTHLDKPWWGVTPADWWFFLCCPGYSFVLSLRLQQPLFARELPIMVLIACAGWCSNHFSAIPFPNRSDLTSAIGSFVVGTLGNLYGKLSHGSSFPVTVVGILFQLPSGLSNGGIFNFASDSTSSGSDQAYSSGFQVAQQLVSVAIGLTVGLFVSAVVTHPFGGGRRSGSGIFSF